MMEALTRIQQLTNLQPEETESKDGYVLQWRKSKSITESLKEQSKFNEWTRDNLTEEEQNALTVTTRAYIRYSLENSKKGESLH